MIVIFLITVLLLLMILNSWNIVRSFRWRKKAQTAEDTLSTLKKKIKQRNWAVDLDLATTAQIFTELSKRGKVIVLIPHKKNNVTFVETLVAQLSPTQTMNVLRVAFTGLADHLGEDPDTENPLEDDES